MDRVLLVGKGPPDHGGIPSFLHGLMGASCRSATPCRSSTSPTQGPGGWPGCRSATSVGPCTTPRPSGGGPGHDIVHINSALAPAVTVVRAGLLVLAGRLRGSAVIVHAHGGNIETWLTTRRARWVTRAAMRGPR